jgi:hypothetical protein
MTIDYQAQAQDLTDSKPVKIQDIKHTVCMSSVRSQGCSSGLQEVAVALLSGRVLINFGVSISHRFRFRREMEALIPGRPSVGTSENAAPPLYNNRFPRYDRRSLKRTVSIKRVSQKCERRRKLGPARARKDVSSQSRSCSPSRGLQPRRQFHGTAADQLSGCRWPELSPAVTWFPP